MSILKLGSTGPSVLYLTKLLNANLYILQPQENFNLVVENKVKKFQAHHDLVVDGIVGPATWSALGVAHNLRDDSTLQLARLKPCQKISLQAPTKAQQQVVSSYNNFGNIVILIAEQLMIDPVSAHAVLAVESAGRGMLNKRMIIRFETHIFWRKWGKYHPTIFNRWFSFSQSEPWKQQTFNNQILHNGEQAREWDALTKAIELSKEEAIESISMGLGQLMGFHYQKLGYDTPSHMFADQQQGERQQLLAFFDFIKQDPTMLTALQEKDWWTFAYHYNGSGQPDLYATWIAERYKILGTLI